MNLKNLTLLSASSILLILNSCNDDEAILKNDDVKSAKSLHYSFNNKTNMISFSGKKSDLKTFVYNSKFQKATLLESSYRSGFIPLSVSPEISDESLYNEIIKKKDESSSLLESLFSNKLSNKSNVDGDISDVETFLEDEDFASILNENGQMQLNDSIYMYTPNGLFIVDKNDYESLDEFIEENSELAIPEGLNYVNDKIVSFKAESSFLQQFRIAPEEPCDGCGGGGGGGSTTPSTPSIPQIPNSSQTTHYTTNVVNPTLGNIFGQQYVAYYKFNGDRQSKTVFEVQDFYLFNSIRAKEKMRKKGWTGIWTGVNANRLYLKINEAIFHIERKTYTVSLNNSTLQPIFDLINKLGTPQNRFVASVSNEYYLDNLTKQYNQRVFEMKLNDLNNFNLNSNSVFYPKSYYTTSSPNMDAFKGLLNLNKKLIVYVSVFNGDKKKIDLSQALKFAADIYKKNAEKGIPQSDIAVVLNQLTEAQDKLNAEPFCIVTRDEVFSTPGSAEKITYDFTVKKEFNLEGFDFTLLFGGGSGNSDTKAKATFKLGYNKVMSYKVNMEGGAYFDNRWGGAKFTVSKEK